MSESEFEMHVEALVAKKLEKPKDMQSQNSQYWLEIVTRQLNFDRGTLSLYLK